jgi:hypothetical protein
MPILTEVGIQFSSDTEIFEVHNIVKGSNRHRLRSAASSDVRRLTLGRVSFGWAEFGNVP